MKEEKCCSAYASYALRIAVGGLLLLMGIGKFKMGVGEFVGAMSGMFDGTVVPMGLATAFLNAVPLAEVVLGALVVLGLWTRWASLLAAYLFSLFVVGLAATGNAEMYGMMANNFLFLFASLWLAKMPTTKVSLDHLVCGNKC